MEKLVLHSSPNGNMTTIPNIFLDEYMPRANGEFVKIYLLLLRLQAKKEEGLTLGRLADLLSCTESDILRAVRYWEKEGLLLLETTDEGELSDIRFVPLSEKKAAPSLSETSRGKEPAEKTAALPAKISEDRKRELMTDEDIRQVFFIVEQYMGHQLSPTEYEKILYYYDVMGFAPEMIEYLFEYCIEGGHRSFHYIDKVASNWYRDGIRTLQEAKDSSRGFNKDYYDILRAFGITNRNPVDTEIRYMKKWLNSWQLSRDIVTEACGRTVLQTGKPSFPYADGILQKWYKAGVTGLSDIEEADKKHEEGRIRSTAARSSSSGTSRNAAAAFSYSGQRSYNIDELEKQLLKGNS